MDHLLFEKHIEASQAYSTQLLIIETDGLFVNSQIGGQLIGAQGPAQLLLEHLVWLPREHCGTPLGQRTFFDPGV
jgi:hypothetical protein